MWQGMKLSFTAEVLLNLILKSSAFEFLNKSSLSFPAIMALTQMQIFHVDIFRHLRPWPVHGDSCRFKLQMEWTLG